MNQILSTGSPDSNEYNEENSSRGNNTNKYKYRNKAPIVSVIKLFVVLLMLFGIAVIGVAGYKMYEEKQEELLNPTKATIIEEQIDSETTTIKVVHDKELVTIEYNWNDESNEIINVEGVTSFEQTFSIPSGTNTLYIVVTDINGETTYFENQYLREEEIDLEIVENDIKVTASTSANIIYMTYRWNSSEETRIEINSNEVEQYIQIPIGTNLLTVILVDENNETIQIAKEVTGITKPIVEIALDEEMENITISMKDEIELEKIEITVEGTVYTEELEGVEFIYNFPASNLKEGLNELEVVVYNNSGVTTEIKVNCEIIN